VVTASGLRFERRRNGIPTIDPGTAPTSRLRTRHRLVQISTLMPSCAASSKPLCNLAYRPSNGNATPSDLPADS
jgi:hypothetical protein